MRVVGADQEDPDRSVGLWERANLELENQGGLGMKAGPCPAPNRWIAGLEASINVNDASASFDTRRGS